MPINGTLLWIWSFLVTLDVQGALVKIPQAAMRRSGAIMISAIWICQQCGLRTITITEKQIWKDEFVESFLCLSPSLIFECGTPQTFTTTSVSLVQKNCFKGDFVVTDDKKPRLYRTGHWYDGQDCSERWSRGDRTDATVPWLGWRLKTRDLQDPLLHKWCRNPAKQAGSIVY